MDWIYQSNDPLIEQLTDADDIRVSCKLNAITADNVYLEYVMRVFALSDIHVDYQENRSWLLNLSSSEYQEDTLILAGDVSYSLDAIKEALNSLLEKFKNLFFVPGNHDLWIRRSVFSNSLEKFQSLLDMCRSIGVHTRPAELKHRSANDSVWIVPLFSWYVTPEENGSSLFVSRDGIDITRYIWADNHYIKWPFQEDGVTIADYFFQMNEIHLQTQYDEPVISFSHFLPRQDLLFGTEYEEILGSLLKQRKHWFNFSRVAGSTRLEEQIRQVGSQIHVYGHQHRNHQQRVDGVLYISHCLGYPHERKKTQFV